MLLSPLYDISLRFKPDDVVPELDLVEVGHVIVTLVKVAAQTLIL